MLVSRSSKVEPRDHEAETCEGDRRPPARQEVSGRPRAAGGRRRPTSLHAGGALRVFQPSAAAGPRVQPGRRSGRPRRCGPAHRRGGARQPAERRRARVIASRGHRARGARAPLLDAPLVRQLPRGELESALRLSGVTIAARRSPRVGLPPHGARLSIIWAMRAAHRARWRGAASRRRHRREAGATSARVCSSSTSAVGEVTPTGCRCGCSSLGAPAAACSRPRSACGWCLPS